MTVRMRGSYAGNDIEIEPGRGAAAAHGVPWLRWLILAAGATVAFAASSSGAQPSRSDTTGRQPIASLVRTVSDTGFRGDSTGPRSDSLASLDERSQLLPAPRFRSRADSITSLRTRHAASSDDALRIVISLNDRRLWALLGSDTLLTAPVAVSTDESLEYAGRRWTFETPRGVRSVIGKRQDPVWTPPDWHYAEVAREHSLGLANLATDQPVTLADGTRLAMKDGLVGIYRPFSETFEPLPVEEHIIFDGTLFIPPIGSQNRRIEGELGRHMLDTGNGYLLHGTPHQASIGTAATHGCIRLRDPDIEWLYEMIPVGTRVYIY